MTAESTFRAKAPAIMADLMADFPISAQDAAAIVGNLGHESMGFTKLQEISPTVKGSRGGYGIAQWTGPRRRAYEAYCKRTGKDPASDEANYAFLYLELKGIEGTEGGAIDKVKDETSLRAKTIAFEKAFLRAGVKHYVSRAQYATWALEAYVAAGRPWSVPKPTTPAEPQTPATNEPIGKVHWLVTLIRVVLEWLIKRLGKK